MSGRGSDQQPGGNPLGGKIKEELLSALRLLFKTAEQYAVDVDLSCNFTAFVTELSAVSEAVQVGFPAPSLSEDVIPSALFSRQTRTLRLVESNGISNTAPCEWQSVLCSEPVFDDLQFEPVEVPFDNMNQTQAGCWLIEGLKVPVKKQAIDKVSSPISKGMGEFKPFTAKTHSIADHLPKVSVKDNPRYYALPIRKASIPPHRFSPEARERFRQALADKSGTQPGNVQLKMIYERMNMGLYAGIQVDETGSLMCTPKSEMIGRNAERTSGVSSRLSQAAAGSESSYLVLGVRLDTKADIRALVPVEGILDASEPGQAGA